MRETVKRRKVKMPNWNIVVQRLGASTKPDEPRFVVWQLDPATPGIKGPDGGKEHKGYTETELRFVLANTYGRTEAAINSLIKIAQSQS
jgi:hypothetical protein